MSLVVLDPGIESRIVDLGRPRTRSLGVPVGGAADRQSFMLGNALLGNPPDAPALEITLKGPRLRAAQDVACVVFGARFNMICADHPVEAGHTFTIPAGSELSIGGTQWSLRAYLCVRGGFAAPLVLGSRSAFAGIKKGDALACAAGRTNRRYAGNLGPLFPDVLPVRMLPGLQADWFDENEFYQQMYTVTPASNRMGLRVSGKPLRVPEREMVSEPVCPGAVQVTRDGQCIVLGVDGQTIGGYPKIAQVIQPHLDMLGQARPGQKIKFVRTTMDKAREMERETSALLREQLLWLQLSLDAFSVARTL